VDEDDVEDVLNFSAAKVKWYQSRARGGVTQLEFSDDSQYLYSASRRSNTILQWDLRRVSSSSFCPGIASYETDSDTNQRIEFAIKDDYLWVGGRDKCIRVYNHKKSGELVDKVDGFQDAVNGVSLTSVGDRTFLAAACGSRQFPSEEDWDKEDPHQSQVQTSSGNLRLYDVKMQCPS
jgi:WD40 repeat protein